MSWTFGGTSISTTANGGSFGAKDINSANNAAILRGDNAKIPLREGRVNVDKIRDNKIISLGYWVVGTSATDYEDKIDAIKKLLVGRKELERTMSDGSKRNAMAEVVNNLGFDRQGPYASLFVADFELAEPFMRSDTQTDSGEITISSSPHDFTFTNPGTAEDRSAIITFHGDLENPKLTNLDNDIWVGVIGAINSPGTEQVDVGEFTIDSEDYDILQHSGDNYFMVLNPGDNSMRLETDTTGGAIQITLYAPFL